MRDTTAEPAPGPWRVIKRGNQTGMRSAIVVSPAQGNRALFWRETPTPEDVANLELASRAPEMAELLREVVTLMRREDQDAEYDWHSNQIERAERLLHGIEARRA